MSRVFNAYAIVFCFTIFLGILPTCLGSVEEVLTSRKGTVSVADVISHRQPLSTSPDVTEKADAYMLMQSDQSTPEEPEVVCGDVSVNVKINSDYINNLRILAPDGSPVPLSKLPAFCKTFVKMLSGSIILVSRFDGCFVQRQVSRYVLPLLWFGRPFQGLCPREEPPLIVCKKTSMQVVFNGENLEENLFVDVNGEWLALQHVPAQCQFDLASFPEFLFLSTPFSGCGMTRKNGIYTLNIQSKEGDMLLSCPDDGSDESADPLSSDVPQPPQPLKCECPCSQIRPSETQVQPTDIETPSLHQVEPETSSPAIENIFHHSVLSLPPSVQPPTIDPPSQTTISKTTAITRLLQELQFRPQPQSQVRQGVKEFAQLLSPALQNLFQHKYPNLPLSGQGLSVSPSKNPQMPKIPATSPLPTEPPSSSEAPTVPVDESEPSNQPASGGDPPPAQSETAPKDQNMQTSYWPGPNEYPALVFVNPFLHPSPQNWQAFMLGKPSQFMKGPVPFWIMNPFLNRELSSHHFG